MTTQRSSLQFRDQFERAAAFFRDRPTLEGVLARRLLSAPAPGDASLADHLARERRRKSRMDGSLGGSLVLTARALCDLLDLGAQVDDAGAVRMAGYLITRKNKPGRWSDDGSAGDGFFSPGPREERIAPLALPKGTTFPDEDAARFVASLPGPPRGTPGRPREPAAGADPSRALVAIRVPDPHLAFVVVGAVGWRLPNTTRASPAW